MSIKKLFLGLPILFINSVFADDYISVNNYIQNPFNGQPSGGGTQVITESTIANDNVWEKWFSDGTYNIQGEGTFANVTGANTYGYGANIFAQTGSVVGISFGGNLAVINPLYPNALNPANTGQTSGNPTANPFLPTNRIIFPNELFGEYKLPNLFQADVGWLYINTPWLTSSDPIALIQPTFRGALLNFQLSKDILITGLATDGYMPISATGFTQATLYNNRYDYGTLTPNILNDTSPSAYALGVQYGMNNAWKANFWGYQFTDYASMLYADTKYTLTLTPNLNLVFAGQAGEQGSQGNNVLAQAGYGTPQSRLVGLQFAVNYTWFDFVASYNTVFGNNTAYEGGGLVSPYTYQLATDPLYTTSTVAGLVEKSAGSAVKLAPTFNFFGNTFTITPSYATYYTNPYPNSQEYDLTLSYALPGVKGLSFNGYLAYLQQSQQVGGNVKYTQLFASYIY